MHPAATGTCSTGFLVLFQAEVSEKEQECGPADEAQLSDVVAGSSVVL